jgi:hypothetical protein
MIEVKRSTITRKKLIVALTVNRGDEFPDQLARSGRQVIILTCPPAILLVPGFGQVGYFEDCCI